MGYFLRSLTVLFLLASLQMSFLVDAQTTKAKCQPGSFSSDGYETCTPCAKDSYSSKQGATSCTSCAKGKTSEEGSSSCVNKIQCQPGYSSNDGYEPCSICPDNTYSSKAKATKCTACRSNQYSKEGSSVCVNKVKCEPGSFSSDGYETCTPCAAGSYSSKLGATKCTLCGTGKTSPEGSSSSSSCVGKAQCKPGYFSDDGYESCTPCAVDSYSDTFKATQCTRCGRGKTSEQGSSSCVDKNQCQPGYFSDDGYAPCTACPKDTFSADSGATQCESCNHPWTSLSGSSSCILKNKCQPGYFSEDGYEDCTPCYPGTYNTNSGEAGCWMCDGQQASRSGSTYCYDETVCDPGSFSDDGFETCKFCPANTYSADYFSEECQPCPPGTESEPGSSSCRRPCAEACDETYKQYSSSCVFGKATYSFAPPRGCNCQASCAEACDALEMRIGNTYNTGYPQGCLAPAGCDCRYKCDSNDDYICSSRKNCIRKFGLAKCPPLPSGCACPP